MAILQAFFLAVRARMGVLSVANTSVIWWGQGLGSEAKEEMLIEQDLDLVEMDTDARPGMYRAKSTLRDYKRDHRLLATCESGPPLEVRVPELETIGWDRLDDRNGESLGTRRGRWEWWKKFTLPRVQEVCGISPDRQRLIGRTG